MKVTFMSIHIHVFDVKFPNSSTEFFSKQLHAQMSPDILLLFPVVILFQAQVLQTFITLFAACNLYLQQVIALELMCLMRVTFMIHLSSGFL